MIFLDNTTPCGIKIDKLESIADIMTMRDIELVVCDDSKMAKINGQYRGIDKATDVLSFPLDGDYDHMPLGTIVISCDHATSVASDMGHTVDDEIALLFIHGLLHILGYDHETDNGNMREKEHVLINEFNLPDSLIIRTENR